MARQIIAYEKVKIVSKQYKFCLVEHLKKYLGCEKLAHNLFPSLLVFYYEVKFLEIHNFR